MKSTKENQKKSDLDDLQVFDDEGNEEDKQSGYFSSFTGYLGKGSKSKKKSQPKEEAKLSSSQIDTESERMIEKAETRHLKESKAMKTRKEEIQEEKK